ncbi:Ubiquitin carboxyl-terminal hydrolase 2 [Beauveria bassiana]|uniref:ubiquitinyl hydrolase 1 n=1 Tax=Beauveria bassiana TaxID=176275 RepID=A0A2N6NKR1_BEABA|nr:Ubiquitin carboxyl-terminal hydrolase 2 [Beauveria bassiana]
MAHFDLAEDGGAGSYYAALPGTSGAGFVRHNTLPIKAKFFASRKEVAGCHPSRWIYELIHNRFTVCDLFDRARAQNAEFDSPYAWDHPHKLVINGKQSYSTGSAHVLSSICLDCHFHFVFKMAWDEEHTPSLCHHSQTAWPLPDNMFPWHHLAWAGSASPGNIASDHCRYNPILAREYFICSAAPCTFQMTLEISEPRMHSRWVTLLLDHEAIRKQLDAAKEQDPARYEGATDEWAYQAPLNLNTYLKNQLESTAETVRSISKRNKRFSVLFGPRCFSIFRELEFEEKIEDSSGIDEGSFTPRPAAPPGGPSGTTEMNTYRAYLEDVRAEVQCLIHKAGQAVEKPTFCTPMLHGVLQCAEVKDVESNALVGTDRYRLLGVLPTQGREIIVNAYKRQWDLLPSSRKELIDALLNVANDAQDDLLIEYAVTQSSVYESQPRQQAVTDDGGTVSQSMSYFGLAPPNNYPAEAIIRAFRKKLADDPAEAGTTRALLMMIASESQDDHYQADLLMEADQKMSLETAKFVIGLNDTSNIVSDAAPATRGKLQQCKKADEKKLYLDALDSIAEHTGSLSLKQAALEMLHDSNTSTTVCSAGSGAPVDLSLPVGLDNIGNTCYLNSLLQYLFTVKPVRDVVFNYDDIKLGLSEDAIENRRIGGNKMQMDRGEAVVADACSSDVDMLNLDNQRTAPLDTASLSSTKTLVEHEEASCGPSDGCVEEISGPNGHTIPPATNTSSGEDAVMVDGATLPTKPSEITQVQKPPPALDRITTDVEMVDPDASGTIDHKVLGALERQKRSSGTDQQDVEEVMGSIINRLQAAIRPSSVDDKTGIQLESLMETFFVTTVNYTKKFDETKYQHEVSFDRSITAFPAENGPCTLYDALGKNFDQQILEESKLSRYTTIRTLPPILHVLIQRTQSNGSKNGNPVIIPETLWLDRFMDTDHDSPAFQRRVEDWIMAKRVADIKADQAKLEANPSYLRALEHYSAVKPVALGQPENEDEAPTEVETFDFDGPVENDFLLISPPKSAAHEQVEAPIPKVTGVYETYRQVTQMMEDELARCESTIAAHHEEMREIPYRLHAVICHRGQLMSGHYWVWIRDFEDDVWRWYNDADVKENKKTEEVLRTLSTSGEPYYLCYGLVTVLGSHDTLVHFILLIGPRPGHSLQGSADGDGSALTDLLREAYGLAESALAGGRQDVCAIALVLGNDFYETVGDAEKVGFGGGDAAAGQDEVTGAAEADKARQAVGAAGAGDDAEARLGQADGGVGGEYAKVRRKCELEAAAEGDGRDGGDGGDGEVGEGGERGAEVAAPLLEVSAGAKARVDGAGNNERAGRAALSRACDGQLLAAGAVLRVNGVDFGAQGGEEALGDGVAGGGAVQLEDADVAGGAGGDVGDADEGFRLGRVEAQRGVAAGAGADGGTDE